MRRCPPRSATQASPAIVRTRAAGRSMVDMTSTSLPRCRSKRGVEVFAPNLPGPGENQILGVHVAGWIKVQAP